MAENKYPSVGGNRSATPKPTPKGPAATGLGELDYSKVIGARVKVTTASPPLTIEGTIFTACPITNILALNTSTVSAGDNRSAAADYKIIPISRIQTFALLSPASTPSKSPTNSASMAFENLRPAIARIDLKALQTREAAGLKKVREKDATRGRGVTKEAQDIFDAMNRSLPTRWDDQRIIVNDVVVISSPYTPDDCRAAKDQQLSLTRVKAVLENERKKLGLQRPDTRLAEDKTSSNKADAKGPGHSRAPTASMVATPLPRKGG